MLASDKPLTAEQIHEVFEENVKVAEIQEGLEAIRVEYEAQGRGIRLVEMGGGYQLVTDPRLSAYVKKFYQGREKKRLSQATLETLSIIAYKQPVTRADVEFIRGVNVDGSLRTLLEKSLVKIVGRKEVPGRPMLYGTTREFLDHFGINSVKELPALNEFSLKDLDPGLLPPGLKESEEAGDERGEGERTLSGESQAEKG